MEQELKIIYFRRLKNYYLYKKANKLKEKVLDLYYNQKLLKKCLRKWQCHISEVHEIQRICYQVKAKKVPMNKIIKSKSQTSLVKLIMAINHDRMNLLRKYFNELKKLV